MFSWIGIGHGIEAARKGLPVVMMPGGSCYLDMACTEKERGHYWAGLLPMEKVYAFNPLVPDSLTPEERSRVLGVEAALWGEMADKPAWYAEYQLFPRLCAVAEVAWTPQEERDFGDFTARLERTHYRRLYEAGIRFRVPFPEVTYADGVLRAEAPYAGAVVRYTADGSEPTCFSTPMSLPSGRRCRSVTVSGRFHAPLGKHRQRDGEATLPEDEGGDEYRPAREDEGGCADGRG